MTRRELLRGACGIPFLGFLSVTRQPGLRDGETETNGIRWWWTGGVLFYYRPEIPKLYSGRVDKDIAEKVVRFMSKSNQEYVRAIDESVSPHVVTDLWVPRWGDVAEDCCRIVGGK